MSNMPARVALYPPKRMSMTPNIAKAPKKRYKLHSCFGE
jgi:hypothetical protein